MPTGAGFAPRECVIRAGLSPEDYGQYASVGPVRNSAEKMTRSPRPVLLFRSKSVSCAAGFERKLAEKSTRSPRPVLPSVPSMSVERPLTLPRTTPFADTSTVFALLYLATREAKFTWPEPFVTRLIDFAGQFTVVPAFCVVNTFMPAVENASETVTPASGALLTSRTVTSKPAGTPPMAVPEVLPTTTASIVEKRGSGTPAEATEATTAKPAAIKRAFRTIPVIFTY